MGNETTRLSQTDSFRESLKDVVTILQKLAPLCDNISDVIGMVSLGLENDGQLALLLSVVASQGKR